jgi:hypothetical protein
VVITGMELKIRHIGIAWVQRKLNDKKNGRKIFCLRAVYLWEGALLFFYL